MRLLKMPHEKPQLILHDMLDKTLDWHLRRSFCLFLASNSIAGQEFLWEAILSAGHAPRHPLPHLSNAALLCKYQQWALCMLYFSKASATLLTFIYICFQRITFLSYERLYRPACLNVVTRKFITRTRGMRFKGPICDPNVNKRVASATNIQNTGLVSAITTK